MQQAVGSLLAACWAYSSTLKIGVVYSFETSITFYQTKWRHITEHNILPSRRRKSLEYEENSFIFYYHVSNI
jgi:hypothetical protein